MTCIQTKSLSLLLGILGGLSSPAFSQTRHPIITKVEILFSMVAHHCHVSDRVEFYNKRGSPLGNNNYAVPHLVYEPVVTLYNPYNEPLTMNRSRIKIWDLPVGFTFKKNDVFLRNDFATGQFHGLPRFQIANESNPNARKSFTLSLSSPTAAQQPGSPIMLQPGESRTFSSWVETNWTWGLEAGTSYDSRSFFDWEAGRYFTDRDRRTNNLFGAEAVSSSFLHYPGDVRAGFQTDGLSYANGRPMATRYDFEIANNWTGNWVALRLNEAVSVQAKATRFQIAAQIPDIYVDLLRGQVTDPIQDRIKSFWMFLSQNLETSADLVVSRTFRIGDILQSPNDLTPGGKTPFAAFTMIAKASGLRANQFYATPAVPHGDLYELHFNEVADFGETLLKPSDAPASGFEIFGCARIGDTLYIDYSGPANEVGYAPGRFRGTASLENDFPDNLGSVTTVMTGQSGSGIYKAIIDVTGRGDRYFVRIEE